MKVKHKTGRKPRTRNTWRDDARCAECVLKAWDALLKRPQRGRKVASYLTGLAKVQAMVAPKQMIGLATLIQHAKEIGDGEREPYEL